MPYTSGIELCKVVRNDPRWSELPILFLTVHSDAEMVNQVFSVGADDFVANPSSDQELVTRILNRLERVKLRRRFAQQGNRGAESEITPFHCPPTPSPHPPHPPSPPIGIPSLMPEPECVKIIAADGYSYWQ